MGRSTFKMETEHFEAVSRLFTVLADPTRLMILYLLKQEPSYVQDIVDKAGLKQPNVSKHLAMLYDSGLVGRERNGNQIRYSIIDPLVFDLCALVCQKLQREAESHAKVMRKMVG